MLERLHRRLVRATAAVCSVALAGAACSAPAPDTSSAPRESTTAATFTNCDQAGAAGAALSDGGLPDLRLPCLGNGPDIELGALTGRPTLVNLWATWCAPCREEMPLLQQAFRDYGSDVRFLGVNTQDDPESATDFLAATGVMYPQALDTEGGLLSGLGLPGLPITLAVDPAGRVIATRIGQLTPDDLASLLEQLLASAAAITTSEK